MADLEEIIDIELASITPDAIHYFVEKGWNDAKHLLQLEWRDLEVQDCFSKMFDQFYDYFLDGDDDSKTKLLQMMGLSCHSTIEDDGTKKDFIVVTLNQRQMHIKGVEHILLQRF